MHGCFFPEILKIQRCMVTNGITGTKLRMGAVPVACLPPLRPLLSAGAGFLLRGFQHHLEVGFGDAALRAGPVSRDVFPARAGLDAVFRIACGFVINVTADYAFPFAHFSCHVEFSLKWLIDQAATLARTER